jgi:uncharacterized protein GlcG (DUF336 family)
MDPAPLITIDIGRAVGSIGGSGGTGERDAECVQVGLDAIK